MIDPKRRVYICGNGGSAANAIHIANDLLSVGVRAHPLTADVSTLTAIANDFGYDNVFSRQLEVFADPGDLLIVLSGSGNSPNILKALEVGKKIGMETWAVVGGGRAGAIADRVFSPDTFDGPFMQIAEEYQLYIGHQWMLEHH